MDKHRIILKIAEMKSYIASDWPDTEERKALYRAIKEMEKMLSGDALQSDPHDASPFAPKAPGSSDPL